MGGGDFVTDGEGHVEPVQEEGEHADPVHGEGGGGGLTRGLWNLGMATAATAPSATTTMRIVPRTLRDTLQPFPPSSSIFSSSDALVVAK